MLVRLIKLIISTGIWVSDSIVKSLNKLIGRVIPGRCVVLYYHLVTYEKRSKFAQQMDDIIRWAKPVTANVKEPFEDGLCYVAITFDDGFESSINNAFPILVERNIPFTLFIPTAYLGRKPEWIDDKEILCREVVIGADKLRKLRNNKLISIGSHCVTHRNLLLLAEEDAKDEILQSKLTLEALLNEKITTLSFPHGGFKNGHIEYAKQAGYERIFSIVPALAFTTREEYVTGRVKADPDDWILEFRLKICGAYRWLPLAFAAKHLLRKSFNLVNGAEND